jgi:plasmid stabilization system protein ParE
LTEAPVTHDVEVTTAAERDLRQIIDYVAEHDLPGRALHVLDAIEARLDA